MECYEYTLPVEKWRQILVNVSLGDLCNVVLTSRHMNSVASLPELWAGMKVNRRKVRENGLAEFYNIKRFKKITEIDFSKWNLKREEWEMLLKDIPGSPLKSANLSWNNLTGVSADLLANAVSSLHFVDLQRTRLTTDQYVALLKASLSSTTLTKVNLRGVNLSQVPADLLASSISRLKDINLFGTELTTDQCFALLKASLSSTTLTIVNLRDVNLSQVPADLLASSISRLQEVNLCRTRLTTNQCVALLNDSLSSTTLTKLNLDSVNLSQVPAELLASSVIRLHDVNLYATDATTDQCFALLKASLSSTTLTKVSLSFINLSQVPADLLASSISRLTHVFLCETHLTTNQRVGLLKAICSSTTLIMVNLDGVDLSQVPAELLANSISRLQDVYLGSTCLTTDQCAELLKAIFLSTTLIKVDIQDVNLSQVPADLLASSISQLHDVNLSRTRLTTNQCIAILKAIPSSTTLLRIDLGWNDILEKLYKPEHQYLFASVPTHVSAKLSTLKH